MTSLIGAAFPRCFLLLLLSLIPPPPLPSSCLNASPLPRPSSRQSILLLLLLSPVVSLLPLSLSASSADAWLLQADSGCCGQDMGKVASCYVDKLFTWVITQVSSC